ncbi:MAG: tetratricopeptide repeat protein [Muribaculaceae bacterium]|nr:tetratricopeptide repeat protein [Muribaculaceae bacterium]
MKRLHILIAILFTATISMAQTLQEAADAYSKENYSASVKIYETLSDSVGVSAELYYNLGNSYYKLKNYPKAVLNYERALLLSPGDEDIKFNLEMAKANVVDKIDVVDRSFLSIWFESIRNIASSNTWASIAIVSFILFLIGMFVYIFGKQVTLKKIGFFGGAILLLLSVYANVASYKQKQKILERNTAIIMSPSITIKSSPSESGTELFILHEGTKVKITDKVGEWSEIKVEDGNSGWIKSSEMEVI